MEQTNAIPTLQLALVLLISQLSLKPEERRSRRKAAGNSGRGINYG